MKLFKLENRVASEKVIAAEHQLVSISLEIRCPIHGLQTVVESSFTIEVEYEDPYIFTKYQCPACKVMCSSLVGGEYE